MIHPKTIMWSELWHITRKALSLGPKYDVALLYRASMRELAVRYYLAKTGKTVTRTKAKYLR